MRPSLYLLWAAALAAPPPAVVAAEAPGREAVETVARILRAPEPPPGVVFEIVTGEEDGLDWALPLVRAQIERLRRRFPALPVAVVTHGEEMFGLAGEAAGGDPELHALAARLRGEHGVTVHVCGTFAGWRGLAPEDFPEVVDVAAAGPAQVNDYRALGWVVVRVSDDD